jgi:ubiquinone/menaquinone biosynthesis C-methylase UbiE
MRGFSTITGKNMMIRYILENLKTTDKILDVGFGQGAYGYLLRQYGYRKIDGVDVTQRTWIIVLKKHIANYSSSQYRILILTITI